jgi:hypothetical protein
MEDYDPLDNVSSIKSARSFSGRTPSGGAADPSGGLQSTVGSGKIHNVNASLIEKLFSEVRMERCILSAL